MVGECAWHTLGSLIFNFIIYYLNLTFFYYWSYSYFIWLHFALCGDQLNTQNIIFPNRYMHLCLKYMSFLSWIQKFDNFVLLDNKKTDDKRYVSKADLRKNLRRMRNGPGRNNCSGGRVENSKGFLPNSFDRVLLDAPCSALGLRPRLFAGEVRVLLVCLTIFRDAVGHKLRMPFRITLLLCLYVLVPILNVDCFSLLNSFLI